MGALLDNLPLFLSGFRTTVWLFLVSAAASLVFGTILAMLRVSPVPILRGIGTLYVTVVRNTPLTLVFLFFIFAYPLLKIVDLSYAVRAMVALSVYTSAFVCEVVRSGINTVPVGQAEAARALGLNFGQTLGSVILPQAMRAVAPPMMSTLIALLKNTTIAAGFSVAEAGAIRAVLADKGYPQMVTLAWVAVGFILLVMVLTLVQRTFEKRWSRAR
ncbi:amino acid ABC transporter permease [Actinokineospora auranticolor]|uniref:Glutamate transport system permease protein n=1 Tax=Actinokineospora auranticolor TaxID=155976 RepID=A0A2S6GCV9_9PSEU|nr:amino acid ABC transporter permease [Actinokineospora auranticolor]PPK62239.1 glutamate transport system permease protein [Actinokineospora auranticolor]